ncbi:ATP-binding protein [Streptomyces sp. NBC_00237]|uniref:ATP-binding protein n=1 Tax=Streptomyces sp. NBC_00237 TaxID=2975687 RepID=UPI00224F1FFF|nr:ATP-binding protein [Streptomyces sp. NBC_00237]MCX5200807.1 ATP-binding protein [Streptomyces sp. NBC_00237]
MESNPESIAPPDSWEYTLTLPHSAIGPGVARSTVRSILVRHALDGLADTAELLTGELCGNAYRHTVGPASVRVSWRKRTLYVGVRDTSNALPRQARPDGSFEDGRGLLLVSLCAHAWGSRPANPGKVTWFELRE